MTTKNLEQMRHDIDNIDAQITDLFKQRMETSLEIAKYKKENAVPVLSDSREKEIMHKISEQIGEPFDGYARLLFNTIFDASRSCQNNYLARKSDLADRIEAALQQTPKLFPKKAVVACQGVAGSYSQAACERLFEVPSIMFFNSFEGVFNAVEKGLCQYGILPIENSSYGSVGAVYDLMQNYNFHIVRGIRQRISHNLMAKAGTKLSDVKEIFSHEQAIGQCGEFLKTLKDVKVTVCENTAVAAKMVAESGRNDVAAISSKECLDLYGLELLQKAHPGERQQLHTLHLHLEEHGDLPGIEQDQSDPFTAARSTFTLSHYCKVRGAGYQPDEAGVKAYTGQRLRVHVLLRSGGFGLLA